MDDGELPRDTRCVLEPLGSESKNLCTFNNTLTKKIRIIKNQDNE